MGQKEAAGEILHLVEVVKREGSWPALWDVALDLGSRHTTFIQYLTKILSHHH